MKEMGFMEGVMYECDTLNEGEAGYYGFMTSNGTYYTWEEMLGIDTSDR